MSNDRALRRRVMPMLLMAVLLLLPGCSENRGDPSVYKRHCASCHGSEGQGLKSLYPPLTDSVYLSERIGELPCLISSGIRGKIVTGKRTKNIRMPAFADLSIQEMNLLVSYLQLNWGKGEETVSEQKISQWMRTCP
ncbi:MAG: c-type cytochrome [Desulfocapsaceae bacterium]